MMKKDYSDYKTSTDYIEYLCQLKGISVKEMCDALDFNFESFVSGYRRRSLRKERAIKVANYLNGDLMKILSLPTRAEYKKLNKESEGK